MPLRNNRSYSKTLETEATFERTFEKLLYWELLKISETMAISYIYLLSLFNVGTEQI